MDKGEGYTTKCLQIQKYHQTTMANNDKYDDCKIVPGPTITILVVDNDSQPTKTKEKFEREQYKKY